MTLFVFCYHMFNNHKHYRLTIVIKFILAFSVGVVNGFYDEKTALLLDSTSVQQTVAFLFFEWYNLLYEEELSHYAEYSQIN